MTRSDRAQLRRALRAKRRSLTPAEQSAAAKALFKLLAQQPLFRRSQHIAFYLANDGEIDPDLLLKHAQRLGKTCYLPVLRRWPRQHMAFQALQPGQRWVKNRYGIAEPQPLRRRQPPAWRLSLIFLPLVGFDSQGNRLGMGGGFYDRALSYKARRHSWSGPKLVGLAHRCQQVEKLTAASWDIGLDAIVTDRQFMPIRVD
ncbi:MAG: 5-formyltetrahydrofolate cyclo-ligase [Gammaproteobacteria bacterium HGW-Gammaproteobacteria-11]|nr:MAG: 5-formyltetrahydrofolate cyclo-ligase [Gammaproteobacteria bacterium HGW-Gammaproteobacteria-11]